MSFETLLVKPTTLAAIGVGAMAASAVLTALITRMLADRQFGKAIRVDGPAHQGKAGTPTMGGLAMLLVLVVVLTPRLWSATPAVAGLILTGLLLFSGLGLVDDLSGLARRSGRKAAGIGLRARETFALQLAAALLLSYGTVHLARESLGPAKGLGNAVLIGLLVLAVMGTANGVNLSDGLDGLAAGLLSIAFGGLLLAGIAPEMRLPAVVALGACLGFLVHNRHPARVFMGNVASMGLGALLAMTAILGGQLLLLPVIGAVFLTEVLSDIIQVAWFKWTRLRTGTGRRVFRMAPIHHHFEALGWPETQIVRRFWWVGILAVLIATGLSHWLV